MKSAGQSVDVVDVSSIMKILFCLLTRIDIWTLRDHCEYIKCTVVHGSARTPAIGRFYEYITRITWNVLKFYC